MILSGYLYGTMIIGLFFVMVLFRKLIHKEGIKSFKIHFNKKGIQLLFMGILIGTIFSVTYIFIALGTRQCVVKFHPDTLNNTFVILFVSLFMFLAIAIFEEGLYRGYILQKIKDKFSLKTGILISSALFGLYHVIPYYGSKYIWIGVINVMVYGVIMSLMYIKHNSNMLNIGFHFVWDIINSLIFSVDNLKMESIVQVIIKEGIFAGSKANPEAGVVMTLLLIPLMIFYINKNQGMSE